MCALKISLSGGGNLQKKFAQLQATGPAHVRAGFLEGATYPDGIPLALVAAAQEFGVPADPAERGKDNDPGEDGSRPPGIPAKHFMRDTCKARSGEWRKALAEQLVAQDYDAEKALGVVGTVMRDDLQQAILTIEEPDVSEATRRRKKGQGKLLIETRVLYRGADSEVVPGAIEKN